VLGVAEFVNTTSSVVVQLPLVIVHLKVAVPIATVTPEVGLAGVAIMAVPETIVHTPVPVPGLLPARVKAAVLQRLWSTPATACIFLLLVSTTVVVDGVHVPFEMVHDNVAVLPANTKMVDVGLAGVVIVAVPETTAHTPVPTVGALAAIVKRESEQCVCAGPATEGVGVA
jgi:hypothetical protein